MEEDMDIQDDHTKEEEEEDESEKPKSKSIYEVEIMEGKREKKTVQRLDMQVPKPKEKLKIESIGKGDKLGDIPRINHAIGRLKAPMLKPLHKIIYDRPGAVASLRKHLRLFNGFPFEFESDPYNKKRIKMSKIPKVQLKSICQILDIERSGSQAVLADRIMQFLVNPTNSGKPVSLKKKRKKKTAKDTKRENKTASKSKKQQMDPGKSKEIVTSSSDEDDDEDDDEDEGDTKNKDTEKSSASDSRKQKGDESDSDEEEESVESDDGLGDSEDEETKSKKSGNKKKPTPKITEDNSDLSASDEDEDNESAEEVAPKKTKKKPSTPKKKPAPKTKKADSSSNRKRKESSKSKAKVESSDEDDQPLIKLIKKPPTNEQLQDKIKDLLKTVNLEEVTMKQICQQVYDLYPDFDLTDRKDVIKDTVKGLIS
ncbi:protein DEK isoform X2 [Astyanax mexicanus]|uniref:protein DEK isoform X2 n=1 Tax=Astyanax mexicanus TaxID=7994 RepID=UPI000440DFAA|nr:protein DEK isoform X2 [Astyanax mexicanus]